MLNALYESYAEIDGNGIMIENKNFTALFYELLRSSIGTPRPIQPPSAYDWSVMYDLAASHAVLGRDCREMPKKVFDFPNELIDKVIEIS